MDTYDIRKDHNQWKFLREGRKEAVATFDTKKQAVAFGGEYLQTYGGHLRIWKGVGEASRVQEEHTYEAEGVRGTIRGIFDGIAEGARDANRAMRQVLPEMVTYLAKGAYNAGFYVAYGVVYGAETVRDLIPLPKPLASGMEAGAEAAASDYGEDQEGVPTTTA